MRSARNGASSRAIALTLHRRVDLVALLLVCGAVVAAFFEVPFEGRTFSTSHHTAGVNGLDPPVRTGDAVDVPADHLRVDKGASSWQFEPWGELVARDIRSAQWPLWNPYSATGKPLAANMQSAVFDPLLLPVHIHPTPLLWDVCFLLALLLGAVGGYAFLRNFGLEAVAAVAGTVAFSLSGYFFVYSNNHFFRSYLYLPWLFLGVDRVTAARTPLAILGLAVAIAGNFVVGMPEATLFVLTAVIVYSSFRILTSTRRRAALAAIAGSGALAAALVLPLALLFLEYVGLSHNTHEPEAMVGAKDEPAHWLLGWLAPFAWASGPAVGRRQWVGAAVVVAVLAALAGTRLTRRSGAWLVAVVGALLVAKVYGAPGSEQVGGLPIFVRADFPAFAPPVAGFCVAVLVGVGVQAIANREPDRRILVVAGCVVFAVSACSVALNHQELLAWPDGILRVAGAGAAFALAGAAVAVLQGRLAAVVVTSVILVELLLLVPRGIYAERAEPYSPPAALQLLRSDGWSRHERTFAFDGKLFPDIPGVLGIADIRTIDGLYPRRFFDYLHTFIQPTAETRFVGAHYGGKAGEEAQPPHMVGNPMWDLLGVRYVLSGGTAPRDATGGVSAQYEVLGTADGTTVYRNSGVSPRAFVVHDIIGVADSNAALHQFEAASERLPNGAFQVTDLDPLRTAVVEGARSRRDTCDRDSTAGIRKYETRVVTIEVDSACPGLLVLTDTYYPGWKAFVNGRSTTIKATDLLFRGVEVPAGRSTVVFAYQPSNFRLGMLGPPTGLLAWVVFTSWWTFRRSPGLPAFRPRAATVRTR